jgi:hypothetical protein
LKKVTVKKISVLIILFIVLVGCCKEKQSFCVDAVVKYGGPPAADGLGWYLSVDSTRGIYYIPKNLSNNYKVDGLRVNTCLYETNDKFQCMCPEPIKVYEITSIRKL